MDIMEDARVYLRMDREIAKQFREVNYPTLTDGASMLFLAWFRAGSHAAPSKGI
jgi:hypothetical protein